MRHTLGLHTKAERDYAQGIADRAYERGLESAGKGDLVALAFDIGQLHAISVLADQEKQVELFQEVSRLRSRLDQKAREIREGHR